MAPAAFGVRPVEDAIPLWPDMRDAYALFCDAPWQWVSFGMGGLVRTGISRVELEASARLLGVEVTARTFADIRTLEAAAIEFWSRKR